MNLKSYPVLFEESTADIASVLREITRIRDSDKAAFDNLKSRFIGGRKTSRIPSSSADVLDTERMGDFTADTNYIYIIVDNGGTLVWRRAALGSW